MRENGIYLDGEKISPAISEVSKIMSYNISNSIDVLLHKIKQEEINLKPEFQRDFVWDIKRASLFIDSLLVGLPIPSILLGKLKEDENFIVIDGQQRLKSVFYFCDGYFYVNGQRKVFRLSSLYDRPWNNKTFDELEPTLQRRLRNAVINSTIIEDVDSNPDIVYDIFYRLNTGGVPLKDQEIRNCIYPGSFLAFLNRINRYKNWRALVGKAIPDRRLEDVEVILRYFALLSDFNNYQPSMRNFLSYFLSKNRNNVSIESELEAIFTKTVDLIFSNIGYHAFKKYNKFNRSICDSIMVAISQCILENKNIYNIKEQYNKLLNNSDYSDYISVTTTSTYNVKGRVLLAKSYFTNEM
ncbi:MAG: DUF262 domain-containing protein [Clostridia bacterium]|nr:DUF262 domain-containing protein [Clostridia bacterium]